jgi:DNA ligase-1
MVKLLESGEGLTGEDEEPTEEDDEDTTNKIKGKGDRKKPLPSTYEPDKVGSKSRRITSKVSGIP